MALGVERHHRTAGKANVSRGETELALSSQAWETSRIYLGEGMGGGWSQVAQVLQVEGHGSVPLKKEGHVL